VDVSYINSPHSSVFVLQQVMEWFNRSSKHIIYRSTTHTWTCRGVGKGVGEVVGVFFFVLFILYSKGCKFLLIIKPMNKLTSGMFQMQLPVSLFSFGANHAD
jgi:hypothetical protein